MSDPFKWYIRYLNLATEVASWSKDRSTQVGAVIIGKDKKPKSFGYNGFPRGIDDDVESRHERPAKYLYTEHAERNAIYNADVPLEGATMFVTHFPCADCARSIIQKGITHLVVDQANNITGELAIRFKDDMEAATIMFDEAGVEVVGVYRNGDHLND